MEIKRKAKSKTNPLRTTPKHWQYPKDKVGRSWWLNEYQNIRMQCVVINTITIKTVQLNLTGWISVLPDVNQEEINRKIFNIKYQLKQKTRNWKNPYFQPELITDIDTTSNVNSRKEYQFFSMEITHFVRPQMIFDKLTIQMLLQNYYQEVIDEILIENNNVFKITRSARMDLRSTIAKQNKLERNL